MEAQLLRLVILASVGSHRARRLLLEGSDAAVEACNLLKRSGVSAASVLSQQNVTRSGNCKFPSHSV